MRLKKGQSAVEFLMTYGWVVIAMGFIIIAVWQTGVLNPMPCEKWMMGFSQVTPIDWAAYRNSDTLVLRVENHAGDEVEVTSANARIGDVMCTTAPATVITPGGKALLILNCSGPPSLSEKYQFGDCYTAEVGITYLNRRSGYNHESRGDVRSGIEEGAVTITTTTTTITTTTTTITSTTTTTLPPGAAIMTCENLQNMKNDVAGDYYLANDIDCSPTNPSSPSFNPGGPWADEKGFKPIGIWFNKFEGSLDGRGYEITDLYINRTTEYNGLFGYTGSGSEIKDVDLVNVNITIIGGFKRYTGSLVGLNRGGTITNCHSTGDVAANFGTGGLVGSNWFNGLITDCYSTCCVTGSMGVGGLVGATCYSAVTDSYSTGNVTGTQHVGGLVGDSKNATINNSYSTGSVTSAGWVGGLVGRQFERASITNSYSTSSVSGGSIAGGLVGLNDDGGVVSNSYSTGSVTGTGDVGGLVGHNSAWISGRINDCYWDIHRSGQIQCKGAGGGPTTCTGKNAGNSEPDYWYHSANAPHNIWDFTSIWEITEGVTYPNLQWE